MRQHWPQLHYLVMLPFLSTDKPGVSTSTALTQVVSLYGTLSLSCSSSAIPQPTIEWQHDKGDLSGPDVTISSTLNKPNRLSSRLERKDVSIDVAGSYSCIASNSLGSSTLRFTVNIGMFVALTQQQTMRPIA